MKDFKYEIEKIKINIDEKNEHKLTNKMIKTLKAIA